MKVAFLVQRGFDLRGASFGGSPSVLYIFRRLVERGHTPILIVPSDREGEEIFDGGKIFYVKDTVNPKDIYAGLLKVVGKAIGNFASVFRFKKIVDREKPELIIYQPSLLAALSLLIKYSFSKTKFVFRHEDSIANLARIRGAKGMQLLLPKFLEWFYCFFSDHILTSQRELTAILIEQYGKFGIPKSKITAVPYSVDFSIFMKKRNKTLKQKKIRYKFLYTGGIGYRQDIPEFLSLVLPVLKKRKDLEFLFVGKEQNNSLSTFIKRNGLYNTIKILPSIEYGKIPELIRSVDFGLTILKNDQGLNYSVPSKTIEYIASGKPVLAYGPPGGKLDQLISGFRAGIFLRKDLDIFNQMEQLIRNRQRFTMNTKKAVNSEVFGTADTFIDVCEKLLKL